MHASERTLNVERTLRAYLGSLSLTGSPEFRWFRDPRKAPEGPWIRVSFDFPGGDPDGDLEGDKATKGSLAVILDLFWPKLGDTDAGNLDAPAVVRDELLAAFRQKLIDLKDYSADPSSPTTLSGHPLRFYQPPDFTPMEADEPWVRTRVTARGFWHHRHQ